VSCDATFAVAILAGGASMRMGRDKALLVHEGRTLLERQVALARRLGPQEVFVVGRTQAALGALRACGLPDAQPGQGPLGGLATVLAAMTTDHVLTVAVDMPALTPEFLGRLLAARAAGVGVVPRTARGWEPTVAVYPRDLADEARRALACGQRALHRLVEAAVAGGRLRGFVVEAGDEGVLVNWNTPEDLAPVAGG
jgi:molybdopterin-guanine dinucleotide biosynthesis protein A